MRTFIRRWRWVIADCLALLFVVCLLVVGTAANAQSTAAVTQYSTRTWSNTATTATGWFLSKSLACAASYASVQAAVPSAGYLGAVAFGAYTGGANAINTSGQVKYSYWDAGSTCDVYVWPVNSGWSYQYSSSYSSQQGTASLGCPPAGDSRFVNFTLGFTDDPQLSKSASVNTYADKFQSILSGGSTCVSGGGSACAVSLANDTASLGSAWISAAPTSQGLYRVSQDFKVTYTGATCTLTADQKMLTESTDTAPACSGSFGTVNGKGVCVPSGAANRNVLQPVGSSPRYAGNPAAGSNAGLPIASRTPSAGTGANDGGPVSPLDGSPAPLGSPLPTTPVTKSAVDLQLTGQCGASGQPPCKIDESGTPGSGEATAATSHTSLDSALQSATDALTTITSAQGKDTSWGVMPTWFQSTTCAPFVLGHFPPPVDRDISIDICPVIPYANGVMNFLWVAFTFFATLSMVFRVMTNAKI